MITSKPYLSPVLVKYFRNGLSFTVISPEPSFNQTSAIARLRCPGKWKWTTFREQKYVSTHLRAQLNRLGGCILTYIAHVISVLHSVMKTHLLTISLWVADFKLWEFTVSWKKLLYIRASYITFLFIKLQSYNFIEEITYFLRGFIACWKTP